MREGYISHRRYSLVSAQYKTRADIEEPSCADDVQAYIDSSVEANLKKAVPTENVDNGNH